MTREQLQKELSDFTETIKVKQAKSTGEGKRVPLMAMIIAKKDGKEVRAMLPIDDSEHRHKIIEFAGKKAHEFFDEVDAIILVSECWMSKQEKDLKEYVRPSEDPDRKEALMISGMTREQITECKMFEIDKDGALLGESPMFAGKDAPDRFESPLLQGFWPKPVNYHRPDFRKEYIA